MMMDTESASKSSGILVLLLVGIPAILFACNAPFAEVQATAEPSPDPSFTPEQVEPLIQDTPGPPPRPTFSTAAPSATSAVPSPTPVPDPAECLAGYGARELYNPYPRPNADPRYTLSEGEFAEYLQVMGISSLCVPAGFGAPYLGVDWDHPEGPESGRRIRIEFENQFRDWDDGKAYIIYATWDFQVGAEYDIFATEEDLELLRAGAMPNAFEQDGVDGFSRFFSGTPMGGANVFKTHIFPFDEYNIAFAFLVGTYEYEQGEEIIAAMEAGNHPDLLQENVLLFDQLVSSIEFIGNLP